jgi:branched-chain amino acid transport system permease protein
VLAVAVVFPLVAGDEYSIHLLVMSGLFFILSAGMNLLLAAGQLTLGHTAFFGIGAYTSGLLALGVGLSPLFGMAIASLFSGVLGYLLGRLTLRLRGAYFVLVTLGFAEVIRLVATNWIELTQGPLGLPGVPAFDFGAAALTVTGKRASYYLVLALSTITFALTARLLQSRFGRALGGIRQNEALAESSGISAYRYTVVATVIACALAGAAGSFYAHYILFLSPELFAFYNTVTMVVMVVAGGQGTVAGPAVGALVFTFVPELLRMASAYRMLVYGIVLLLFVMFLPRGITHYASRLLPRRLALPTPQRASRKIEERHGFAGTLRTRGAWGARSRPPMMRTDPVLEASGLSVSFGGLVAVQELSFALRGGEILALIGPNGAGKSTVFNVVTGFYLPSAGRVTLNGEDITGHLPHAICERGLVRMFQKASLFPESTVLENVITACHRLGRASLGAVVVNSGATRREEEALRARAESLVGLTGLVDRAQVAARSLSYGEQRLLGLAIALAPDPTVLLLDEPAAGLNAVETARVMALIEDIRKNGLSILLVEHDMRLVMGISDRIVVLNHGQKIAEGTPAEIQRHPEVVRAYLGSREPHARA